MKILSFVGSQLFFVCSVLFLPTQKIKFDSSGDLLTVNHSLTNLTLSCSGNAVVVVVIVSMGLLITVLAVGVVKLKSAVTRDEEAAREAEDGWEDGPNITLNPLEVSDHW